MIDSVLLNKLRQWVISEQFFRVNRCSELENTQGYLLCLSDMMDMIINLEHGVDIEEAIKINNPRNK